jgi:replicative DNA helicase
MRDAFSKNFTSDELVQNFERRAFGLGRGATAIKITSIQDVAAATMKRFDELTNNGPAGSIVFTGFGNIDAMTGGLRNRMYVLGARPGQGKSSFGLNVAANVAFNQRIPTLFVSIEMDNEELGERLLADLASVDSKHIRIPQLARDEDRYRLQKAFDNIGDAPLSFIEEGTMTPSQIASACRRQKAAHGLGFVVIDYIQLVTPENSREGRHEQMASVSRAITALAKELNVPILALAQLNRQVEGRSDKELNLSDLRETGQFEQDAHGVWFIQPESEELMKFKVAKNRGGPVGSTHLRFEPKFTRFTEQYNDRF